MQWMRFVVEFRVPSGLRWFCQVWPHSSLGGRTASDIYTGPRSGLDNSTVTSEFCLHPFPQARSKEVARQFFVLTPARRVLIPCHTNTTTAKQELLLMLQPEWVLKGDIVPERQ
jgi:hypothetical protein